MNKKTDHQLEPLTCYVSEPLTLSGKYRTMVLWNIFQNSRKFVACAITLVLTCCTLKRSRARGLNDYRGVFGKNEYFALYHGDLYSSCEYRIILPVPHKGFDRFHGHLCARKRSRADIFLAIPKFANTLVMRMLLLCGGWLCRRAINSTETSVKTAFYYIVTVPAHITYICARIVWMWEKGRDSAFLWL